MVFFTPFSKVGSRPGIMGIYRAVFRETLKNGSAFLSHVL